MKRLLISLILVLAGTAAFAQTTKVRGVVREASTGEAVPFAGVYFKGTSIGQSTDLQGRYSIETSDLSQVTLVCQLLGYIPCEITIVPGQFNNKDFYIEVNEHELSGVVVKADDRKIRALLANIELNQGKNDPQSYPYVCDIYSKMELDIVNAENQLNHGRFARELGFVFDYMDTSSVSGMPYLPAMLSESVTRRTHGCNPEMEQETIVANKISGINPENNMLTEYSGSMHLKANFYKNYINCMGVEFPSPVRASGLDYYNYYVVDSLDVDSRKTYVVRYHPKKGVSIPVLDGEMRIDAEDFAVRSVKGKMMHEGKVNWVRDIVMESEYCKLPDDRWFHSVDRIYGDFSVVSSDSSKFLSFIGRRAITYMNPSFENVEPVASDGKIKILPIANTRGENYWVERRPEPLTRREQDIYTMVDKVKQQPLYDTYYSLTNALITGYWDFKYVGLGGIYKCISFNDLEGFRPQVGIHTTHNLSSEYRWTAYLAYGCRDREFKGGFTYEQLFKKDPTRKLTLDARYDEVQLGRGSSYFTTGNIFSSIFGKWGRQRPAPQLGVSLKYEHEFNPNFNAQADMAIKRIYPNYLVPMVRVDGTALDVFCTNELHAMLRFSKEETVNRGRFEKIYLNTYYPVVTVNLTGGVPGWHKNCYSFFRPEVALDWKIKMPPVGTSTVHFDVGTILGQVPYPLLHLFEGNPTFLLDKGAFSCMDFFEFASDTWATLYWNHSFEGLLLGLIPGVKRLNLREEFTFRAAYGVLSDKNNPSLEGASADMIRFPEGMKPMGNMPYMEIGAGISNIFKLFRVDCFWRLTHRDEGRQFFCVNLGIELKL